MAAPNELPRALAIIADVHGNVLALEAVLADIRRRGLAQIVNLGDSVNGPLEPARSYDLLRQIDAVHVRGNGDRMTAEGGHGCSKSGSFARERLDSEALAWLGALPTAHDAGSWLSFHGSPKSDSEYLLESVAEDGARFCCGRRRMWRKKSPDRLKLRYFCAAIRIFRVWSAFRTGA